jgi:hypothetical protein
MGMIEKSAKGEAAMLLANVPVSPHDVALEDPVSS